MAVHRRKTGRLNFRGLWYVAAMAKVIGTELLRKAPAVLSAIFYGVGWAAAAGRHGVGRAITGSGSRSRR